MKEGHLFIFRGVCVQPHPSAVSVTLPAFAAERRAAAPLLLSPGACYRSISPVRGALSSKPAACRCCGRPMGRQTDGQMDGRTDA